MSLLWGKSKNKKKNRKNSMKGDFAVVSFLKTCVMSAQDANLFFLRLSFPRKTIQSSIEGTSPHMSGRLKASMTVEAALVLPLFLLFFLNIGSIMEMMRVHSNLEMALWETGREVCLYGAALKENMVEESSDLAETVGNLALSYTYVKGRVEKYVGAEYLEAAPIKGGKDGIQYLGSEILREDDCIELKLSYVCEPKWALEGFRTFLLENHYYGRIWTGYEIPEETEIYYLSENMDVFHRDRNCSHLLLKKRSIAWEDVPKVVNEKGSHYRPCEKCAKGSHGNSVWIAQEGECYHFKEDCPGLKRTVLEVPWEVASKYRACSRCGRK